MKLGSLFSGAGMLDYAVEHVFNARTVWHCELDPAASKVLAHRFPGVPNHRDITAVDWAAVAPVDILCGGFPCTDVSAAGKRAGLHNTRSGLWSYMRDAIDALRPQYVVIENVRGLLNANANRPMEPETDAVGNGDTVPVLRAIGAVLGDLADIGAYDARWVTVSAASVGAPHRRERVFIVARNATSARWRSHGSTAAIREVQRELSGATGHGPASDSGGDGRGGDTQRYSQQVEPELAASQQRNFNGRGVAAADSSRDGRHEGRPEPARLVGGSDAALSGDGPVDLLPTPSSRCSDLLPTPLARDSRQACAADYDRHTPSLAAITHYLPTPNASECTGGGQRPDAPGRLGHSHQLIDYALLADTPQWGKYEPAIKRWEQLTRPAPSPTEPNRNGNPRLAAAFSEWMLGWPAGWVTTVPGISRNDALRIVGNGVCPQQATAALRWLLNISEVAA